MGAHFCCCLPLRFGVLLISFFQFLVTGAGAGGLWWLLWYLTSHEADALAEYSNLKTALIVGGAIYTLGALVGLFGFLGAIFKKNGLIRTFLFALYVVLLLHIASGTFVLVMYYRARNQTHEDCMSKSDRPQQKEFCDALDQLKTVSQAGVIIWAAVPILIQAYASLIVHQYSRRLSQQKMERDQTFVAFKSRGPSYQPVAAGDESHPLTQATAYPYSDNSHSFGAGVTVPSIPHDSSKYDPPNYSSRA